MRNMLGFGRERVYRQAGFTLLELLVVTCIISVLATVLLNRVRFYQKMAEKTAMEQTVGILRSALQLQFAALITQDKVGDAQYLIGRNPMNWLTEKPVNYAGEFYGVEPEDVASGQWYFDLRDRNLVYLVHNHKNEKSVRARVVFAQELVLGVKGFPVSEGRIAGKKIEGVVLQQIVPFVWD